MLFAVGMALLLWWLMGTLIVRERIPSFIVTLGGLLVFRGLFWLLIEYKTVAGADSGIYLRGAPQVQMRGGGGGGGGHAGHAGGRG